jgi:hypothetical protein
LLPRDPFRSAADQSCKPPVTYGCDWNPRLVISGLWLPAYVETRSADYILCYKNKKKPVVLKQMNV